MINLLPPRLKVQKRYAIANRRLVTYLSWVVIIILSISAAFFASWVVLNQNIAAIDSKLADQDRSALQFGGIENDAKQLADRLESIEKIQGTQTHYTNLLKELAAVTPKDTYIYSLQITDSATMNLTAWAETEQAAANFKNSIEQSSRFSSAAIKGLDSDRDPYTGKASFRLSLLVGLKSGALQ